MSPGSVRGEVGRCVWRHCHAPGIDTHERAQYPTSVLPTSISFLHEPAEQTRAPPANEQSRTHHSSRERRRREEGLG